MRAQPAVFFHPLAIEHFRTYLKNRYSPELLKKRLGFSDVRYIEPPKFNQPFSTMDDPLFQDGQTSDARKVLISTEKWKITSED